MNITENNRLIAEFLDWEFDDLSETFETPFLKLVDPHAFGDEQFSCKLQDFELEFHSDWNWLMEVVKKIDEISLNAPTIWNLEGKTTDIFNSIREVNIELTHNRVIDFIKFYNNQNKVS